MERIYLSQTSQSNIDEEKTFRYYFQTWLASRHTPGADQSEFVIDLELLSGFQLIYCNPLVGTTTVGILILFHIQLFFYLQSKSAREQRRSKILWPRRVQASNSDNHRPALAMAPSKCVLAPRVTSNPTFYCRGIKDPSMTSTQLISIILPSPGCAESFPTSLEQHVSAFSTTLFSGLIWRCVILFHPICNLKCTLLVSAFVSLSPWHASGSSSSADQACCMDLLNIWQKPEKG